MKRSTPCCAGADGRSVPGVTRSRSRWPARRYGVVALVLFAVAAFSATAGATAAPTVRPVVLPGDQGAHPGFGDEWWYTSGTLSGANRRAYFGSRRSGLPTERSSPRSTSSTSGRTA
jgi:predicted secreted hydrolase